MSFVARRAECVAEVHTGRGPGGTLLQSDVRSNSAAILGRFSGKAQTVYLDPPFNTGKAFSCSQRVGSAGWRSGTPSIELTAYSDRWKDEDALLALFREAAETAHALLSDDGSLFFHIDSRMHAQVRMILDKVFGRQLFINEIIWSYHTGGRATSHFSRKHDTILFYRKTTNAFFDLRAVAVKREDARRNHMRRGVDEQGRSYRSIVSLGKEYRYYDDEMTLLSDVWDDIPQMQQKDPQRT
ncbi:MAG: site-specific DNA-methyltransferase, partial [Clostridia bacterium]|nr:site-specific DNA-methyltransferase [Clostridia bacterium]